MNKTALFDLIASPAVYVGARLMSRIRGGGIQRYPRCRRVLERVGVFPIRDHYYEPLFHPRHLRHPLREDRDLQAIDWNVEEQLELLGRFGFADELDALPRKKTDELRYTYDNNGFRAGDAEFLYSLIRLEKPRRMIEIGSGNSTLMAREAVEANVTEDPGYSCEHVCIEPYEMPWLEKLGIQVHRQPVEEVDLTLFDRLGDGDVLFIDSSHMIRPQGDVLFEVMRILPRLAPGVYVHVHDIFTPHDYPESWVRDEVRLWNEQYLLEAFLMYNREFRIVGALNYLALYHREALLRACPVLAEEIHRRDPGSFWMRRNRP
jgi:hypothetical protein